MLEYSRDNNDNKEVAFVFTKDFKKRYEFVGDEERIDFGSTLVSKGDNLFIMHNHPRNSSFSDRDVGLIIQNEKVKVLTIVKNNGLIETLSKTDSYSRVKAKRMLGKCYKETVISDNDSEIAKAINKFLNKYGGLEWKK